MKREIHVPLLPVSNHAVRAIADVLERATLAEFSTGDDTHRRILAMNPTLARQIKREIQERAA